MYLKSLEIQGFKSFPDKTLIHLGRGITAIVGPNGSGKSNIVDAIRWVLGEQSVKTLRGGKMEDVIFGGTLKRSPQGFCQVALTIDNHDGGLPLEYEEIEVARRYYRSGESEFFINKKAVRLKDVHELFMDTGLGRDGYSVIGQGRIDEILSVKSVDRREIFEEASGISKYRYRKEESERKLASTEENLVRVRDIITELEGQVEPLRVQSEKARSFLVYRDELRVLEVSVWLDSLEKLKESLQKARTDFENAERMLSAKKAELEELYGKNEALSQDIQMRQTREDELRAELRDTENEIAATDSSMAVAETTLKNNEQNVLGKKSELSEQSGRGKQYEESLSELQKRVAEIEKRAAKLERQITEVTESAAGAMAQGNALAGKLAAVTQEMQTAAEKRNAIKSKADSLAALRAEIESGTDKSSQEMRQLSEKLAQERKNAAETDAEIAKNEEKKQSALNMIRGFELRLSAREKKAADAEEALRQKERECAGKQDRKKILESLERDYEGFSLAVKKVMQASGRELHGLHGPVSSLIETDDRYTVAIETALGAAMQFIVTDREEDAKQAINFLKRVGGRATFQPLTSVRVRDGGRRDISRENGVFGYADGLVRRDSRYDRLVTSLLGTTAVCSDIDCAIALARKTGYAFKIVTLDGQLINPSGSMTGGSVSRNTGILSRANELARLSKEIESMTAEMREERNRLGELKRELEASKYESDVAKEELRTAENALISLNASKHQHAILLSELESREGELRSVSRNAETRIAEIEKRTGELESELAACDAAYEKLEAEKDGVTREMEESGSRSREMAEKISSLRAETAALSTEKTEKNQRIEELQALISQTGGDIKSKEEAIAEIEKNSAGLRLEIERLTEKRNAQNEAAEGRRRLIAASVSDRLRIEGERTKCQKAAQSCNDELLLLERERSRLENKKIQSENEENSILDKMWESYELTRTSALEVRIELPSLSAANRRIGELRSAIRKLGSVNVDAIEEYARVSERYTFLSEQRDDLEKAKTDLLKIIDDITRNMKTIFAEQFKLINEEFGRTFVEIFGGGSALLRLEDENDILNCGIEIKVEMPGKSMRAISLLSGGEKAFVAIALYFAVIKVRPTPFCVLDEIEAALDDVNVARYAAYMRKLCDKTQFIVITHRRGTMEGSDMLYGVTMPEQGVTKLLALNINEVEEKIKVQLN